MLYELDCEVNNLKIQMMIEVQIAKETYTTQLLKEQLKQKEGITHLRLHLNLNESIIKQISGVEYSFSSLVVLNIGYNQISSLQRLQKVDFPNLQQLHLFQNYLISLVSLKKVTMPCLKFVSFVHNYLQNLQGLSEWNCPNLQQLMIYDNPLINISALFRSNLYKIRNLCLGDKFDDDNNLQYIFFMRFPNYQE